jgi:HSP20 family protein
MVERRGAFSELITLQKEVNRLFEQLAQIDQAETGMAPGEWCPPVDIFESDENLIVKVETPGLSSEDISVAFKGSKLIIAGEKKEPKEAEPASYLCLERTFGRFSRTIYVDQAVEFTKATAEMQNGVLTIIMPMLKDRRGGQFRLAVRDKDKGGR